MNRDAATGLAHIGGVAAEEVVGHTEEELLQSVPEKWVGRKLAFNGGRIRWLAAPRRDRGRHLAADLQVELLCLLHAGFGQGCSFTEET